MRNLVHGNQSRFPGRTLRSLPRAAAAGLVSLMGTAGLPCLIPDALAAGELKNPEGKADSKALEIASEAPPAPPPGKKQPPRAKIASAFFDTTTSTCKVTAEGKGFLIGQIVQTSLKTEKKRTVIEGKVTEKLLGDVFVAALPGIDAKSCEKLQDRRLVGFDDVRRPIDMPLSILSRTTFSLFASARLMSMKGLHILRPNDAIDLPLISGAGGEVRVFPGAVAESGWAWVRSIGLFAAGDYTITQPTLTLEDDSSSKFSHSSLHAGIASVIPFFGNRLIPEIKLTALSRRELTFTLAEEGDYGRQLLRNLVARGSAAHGKVTFVFNRYFSMNMFGGGDFLVRSEVTSLSEEEALRMEIKQNSRVAAENVVSTFDMRNEETVEKPTGHSFGGGLSLHTKRASLGFLYVYDVTRGNIVFGAADGSRKTSSLELESHNLRLALELGF